MDFKPVSIIIPCFNQGQFLIDAITGLKSCDNNLFEIIIVNDGSTDKVTNEYIDKLANEGYKVIIQENKGLGAARNTGIQNSTGKYILPLDADNKIKNNYILKGIEILDANEDTAVVYGNAAYFGDKSGVLKPGKFNLQRLMLGNYIDACAVIRRSALEAVGLYDNMQIMGYEDWDLWLRLAFKGYGFYYIDEVLFDYRFSAQSMMRTLNADIARQNAIEDYFSKKYEDKLSFQFAQDKFIYKIKQKPVSFLYQLVLKKYFPSYYDKLIQENKIYKNKVF